jgi:nitrite reductase/ring-hydroxylating ferredoxin subunit
VVARLADLGDPGAREFFVGDGDWPFRGFLVQVDGALRAYANVCPHKRHPLNLTDDEFLVPGQKLLHCASHGALFEPESASPSSAPARGARSLRWNAHRERRDPGEGRAPSDDLFQGLRTLEQDPRNRALHPLVAVTKSAVVEALVLSSFSGRSSVSHPRSRTSLPASMGSAPFRASRPRQFLNGAVSAGSTVRSLSSTATTSKVLPSPCGTSSPLPGPGVKSALAHVHGPCDLSFYSAFAYVDFWGNQL